MMRIERPRHAFALLIEPRRFGVLASLTASLFLGACSQSPELLQSLALKPDKTDASDESPPCPKRSCRRRPSIGEKEYAKKPTELQTALNYARDLKALGEKRKAMSYSAAGEQAPQQRPVTRRESTGA